jgi:hypothetical protein
MHLVSSLPGSGNGGEQRCHLSVVFPHSILHGATGTRQTPQSLPRVHGSHRWAVNLFQSQLALRLSKKASHATSQGLARDLAAF